MTAAISPSAAAAASPRGALAALSLATLLPSLGISIANMALPTLAQAFDTSFQGVQWIVLAYLLAITTLIVSVGRLGDMIGRRRLLMVGVILFTAASGLCGVASTLWLMIAARVAQGLGAAVLMALSMALVGETVAKDRSGRAMGLLGTMSAAGTALGPSLGGVLIAAFGWPAIFLVNLPLGAIALLLALRFLAPDRSAATSEQRHFDIPGTALLATTLALYALAMTVGHGHFGVVNVALVLAAAAGGGLFGLAETKARAPLIRLGMVRDAERIAGLTTSALVAAVMMTTFVVGPFYLSLALGLDPVRVGLVMSVGPITAALSGVLAGHIVDRLGASSIVIAGLAQMAVGLVALCTVPIIFGTAGYVAGIIVLSAGYQMFQAANNTAVMTGVALDQRGVVSGLLNLSRNLGFITGASVMGAVFATASAATDITTAQPAAVASGMQVTFAAAALLMVVALATAVKARLRRRR